MNPSYNDDFGSFSNGQGGANSPIYGGGQQPSFSSASTGGPVVLTPTNNAKPRKGIKALLAVLVLFVVVAGGVFALWKGGVFGGGDKNETLKAFYEIANYVMSGKLDDNSLSELANQYNLFVDSYDDNDSSLYAIDVREQSFSEIEDYYKVLDKRVQSFSLLVNETVGAESSEKYVETLKVLKNAINYYSVRNGLIDLYEDGGKSNAVAFIDREIACNNHEWYLAIICSNEEQYYRWFLQEYIDGNNDGGDGINWFLKSNILDENSLRLLDVAVREQQERFLEDF